MRGDCLIYTAIDSRAFPILFIRLLPPTTTLSPPLLSCASAANDDHLNYVHIIHYMVCVCTSNIKLAEAKLSEKVRNLGENSPIAKKRQNAVEARSLAHSVRNRRLIIIIIVFSLARENFH